MSVNCGAPAGGCAPGGTAPGGTAPGTSAPGGAAAAGTSCTSCCLSMMDWCSFSAISLAFFCSMWSCSLASAFLYSWPSTPSSASLITPRLRFNTSKPFLSCMRSSTVRSSKCVIWPSRSFRLNSLVSFTESFCSSGTPSGVGTAPAITPECWASALIAVNTCSSSRSR